MIGMTEAIMKRYKHPREKQNSGNSVTADHVSNHVSDTWGLQTLSSDVSFWLHETSLDAFKNVNNRYLLV